MSRVALDTNILAYVAGVNRHPDDAAKIDASRTLLKRLRGRASLVVPVQVMGELFVVLTRAGASRGDARATVLRMTEAFGAADSSASALFSALDLVAAHQLQFWDALILNAAAEAGCTLLLSEDMSNGFSWRGVTVLNPLAATTDDRLARLYA
ncbi:PIN domain-containing protein [Sphingomonas lenta]|uniref:VapC toxin family PIN domain ribonuclease n=1 Tax=Sphingomonas lenta TaxID=1141887 RepID=A0A2A2SII4_9SPHN|nr:PIN domain-containing protein [Sphingomonas lenta]PAX09033.1 VapC toxin family PIN domain ribonuclease [Sphingomonas lenta]